MKKLVLASGSPRRRDYMEAAGIPFTVKVKNCDETLPPGVAPGEGVKEVAERKALEVLRDEDPQSAVLAADTIVVVDGEVMGKPADAAQAAAMLSILSGREHLVVTGVALASAGTTRSFSVTTKVRFRKLDPEMIKWYLDSGEPYDKAGAYGIQGLGGFFVEAIEGSYSNVVGLPLVETLDLLKSEGITPWSAST